MKMTYITPVTTSTSVVNMQQICIVSIKGNLQYGGNLPDNIDPA